MPKRNDHRLEILSKVREGKLDIGSAMQQLRQVDSAANQALIGEANQASNRHDDENAGFELRLIKTDLVSFQPVVDIRIPVDLIQAGIRLGASFGLEASGLSSTDLVKKIEQLKAEELSLPLLLHEQLDEQKNSQTQVLLGRPND